MSSFPLCQERVNELAPIGVVRPLELLKQAHQLSQLRSHVQFWCIARVRALWQPIDAPGRWHREGERVVYASLSSALAVLDAWVHLKGEDVDRCHWIGDSEPYDGLCHFISEDMLPVRSRVLPDYPRTVGSAWLDRADTAVLCAPSALVAQAFNVAMNPQHSDGRMAGWVRSPLPYFFDEPMR